MSARIPPSFGELWFQFNVGGDPEPMYCALGVDLAAGVVPNQGEADTMLSTGIAALNDIVNDDYGLGPGHVIYGNDGGDIRIDSSITQVAGARTGTPVPQNTAFLVRKLTGSGGRRNRGRMYIPGVTNTDVTAIGGCTSGILTIAAATCTALQANLVALGTIDGLVLFHETAPFTPTPITSLEIQPRVATQRRRMRP